MSILASSTAESRRRTTGSAGLLLAGPFALLLLGTVLVPVGYALYLSLFTERLSGLGFAGPERVFVALGNYVEALADPAFQASVGVVVVYALLQIPIMLGLALLLALLLDSAVVRLRQFWTLAVFLPYAVPAVIAGLIWAYLYSPGIGPINNLLWFDPLGADGSHGVDRQHLDVAVGRLQHDHLLHGAAGGAARRAGGGAGGRSGRGPAGPRDQGAADPAHRLRRAACSP